MARILIIDHEESDRETLGVFCEMLGHEPLFAADASSCKAIHSANKHCTEESPCADILLIDQKLPTMTGLAFVSQQSQKGCQAAAHCKAIMSGSLTSDEFRLAKKLDCHVLQKPVTYEILENWLNSVDDKNKKILATN